MVIYKQASTETELHQILQLQKQNLPENLTELEKEKEGFVTVRHNINLLQRMNNACAHTIAIHKNSVVGYALSMHPKFAEEIEILRPMFREIEKVFPNTDSFIVMGQICIAKGYRGKGIFRGLYKSMKQFLGQKFDAIITEVDTENQRSLDAHKALGFIELKRYPSNGKVWSLIVLK